MSFLRLPAQRMAHFYYLHLFTSLWNDVCWTSCWACLSISNTLRNHSQHMFLVSVLCQGSGIVAAITFTLYSMAFALGKSIHARMSPSHCWKMLQNSQNQHFVAHSFILAAFSMLFWQPVYVSLFLFCVLLVFILRVWQGWKQTFRSASVLIQTSIKTHRQFRILCFEGIS